MIIKNEKKKFSDCKNIEQRSISWLELRLDHLMSEKVAKLNAFGLGFYSIIIKIFMQKFDYLNPGALKIEYKYFREMFPIKRRETILNYLKILQELKLVFYWREGIYVILYCPYVEEATEYFVKKRKRSLVENPAIAGDLLARCKVCKVEFKPDPF